METAAAMPVARQIHHELVGVLREWDQARVCLDRSCATDEAVFVHWAGLAQRTRAFVRLLGEEHAETVAVAMEAVCTLIVSGLLHASPSLNEQLALGMEGLCRTLEQALAPDADSPTVRSGDSRNDREHALVQAAHHLIRHLNIAAQNAYGGPCVAFPVEAVDPGHEPLRIRGFDLLRLETEGLGLYVLEFSRPDVILRGGGIGGLLFSLGRSGHVFDVRTGARPYCRFPAQDHCPEDVLRVLYGSTLKPDFVEALTGLSTDRIFAVNPVRVSRYQPSWGESRHAGAAPAPHRRASNADIEALVREYDQALSRLFSSSKHRV